MARSTGTVSAASPPSCAATIGRAILWHPTPGFSLALLPKFHGASFGHDRVVMTFGAAPDVSGSARSPGRCPVPAVVEDWLDREGLKVRKRPVITEPSAWHRVNAFGGVHRVTARPRCRP